VVPSESMASWPIDTLKAQAVAARTYAIYQINHRKDWDYDLVDFAGDQSYKGVLREHERSTRAVDESAGMILEYNGRPIYAMYTANSGGITADPQYIFNIKQPYLFIQDDPASTKGSQATWTKGYKISEIEEKLKTVGCDLKGIKDIKPHTVDPSGRVIKVNIIHSGGETSLRTWSTLRRALSLREILLETERRGDTIYFKVKGHGHGIGYSQEGGAIMGKTEEFKDILSFYYPKADIVKRWQ
ncbi:SpoIID/LytB domain-containing protein, partial [bacterium]|nr:SpoIID/LytB domain-containing protein [bacterium]